MDSRTPHPVQDSRMEQQNVNTCEGYNVNGQWVDCDRPMPHGHGIEQDAYAEQRTRELQPLADALAIHVRGATDARVEQTGGNVYCAVITLGAWTVYGDEYGWSITDNSDGSSFAYGDWYNLPPQSTRPIPTDDDTGALDVDSCDAAAVTFAAAVQSIIGQGA